MAKRSASVSVPLGLGERIRSAREEVGLTQSELSRAVGVSKSAVSQWEKGAVQNLKLGNLFATAQALGKDVRELVFGEGRGAGPRGARAAGQVADRRGPYHDLSPREQALIRDYERLPRELRTHIHALITLLAAREQG